MSESEAPLYEIYPNQLNTGLRGYPVGTCQTSSVHKEDGVSYSGYRMLELATLSSECAIFLLLYKRLPTADEVYAGKVKATSGDEVGMILESARRVAIVPGYGLAVSQAQHQVRQLARFNRTALLLLKDLPGGIDSYRAQRLQH